MYLSHLHFTNEIDVTALHVSLRVLIKYANEYLIKFVIQTFTANMQFATGFVSNATSSMKVVTTQKP